MAIQSASILFFGNIYLIISVAGQSVNHLSCYVCESKNVPACEDPANTAVLPSVDCSTMVYPSPQEGDERRVVSQVLADVEHEKFKGSPIIGEIFQGNAGERSSLAFRYVCLKVTFTADGKSGTTRTCERLSNNIRDACDFIRQDTNPKLKVHSCGSCVTNNCNSASFKDNSECETDDCSSGSDLNANVLIVLLYSLYLSISILK